jgi:hypothetical protein
VGSLLVWWAKEFVLTNLIEVPINVGLLWQYGWRRIALGTLLVNAITHPTFTVAIFVSALRQRGAVVMVAEIMIIATEFLLLMEAGRLPPSARVRVAASVALANSASYLLSLV